MSRLEKMCLLHYGLAASMKYGGAAPCMTALHGWTIGLIFRHHKSCGVTYKIALEPRKLLLEPRFLEQARQHGKVTPRPPGRNSWNTSLPVRTAGKGSRWSWTHRFAARRMSRIVRFAAIPSRSVMRLTMKAALTLTPGFLSDQQL